MQIAIFSDDFFLNVSFFGWHQMAVYNGIYLKIQGNDNFQSHVLKCKHMLFYVCRRNPGCIRQWIQID